MLVYIAHALGRDPIKRPENIARVQRWFKFLIDYGPESWAFQIPWLVYAQNLDEDTYRERGIRDGQMACATMDIICLVGGEDTRNSMGAAAERGLFMGRGKGVCDLTFLGAEPPTKEIVTNDGLFLGTEHLTEWGAKGKLTGPLPAMIPAFNAAVFPLQRANVTRVILKHLVR